MIKGGALTGLTSVAETLRKIDIFVARPTRGPCVAHSKFGPILGIEPVPSGTPCIALRYPATCDSAPPNKRHRALVKDWCLAKPDPSRSNVDRSSQHQRGPKPISLPVSAIGYRLSAIGYRLSAIGYRLQPSSQREVKFWNAQTVKAALPVRFGSPAPRRFVGTTGSASGVVSVIAPTKALPSDLALPWYWPSSGYASEAEHKISCCGCALSSGKVRGAERSQCNDEVHV